MDDNNVNNNHHTIITIIAVRADTVPNNRMLVFCFPERVDQTLPVTDVQPGTATGTGELAEQPPPPSAGTGPGAGDGGETAAGSRGA